MTEINEYFDRRISQKLSVLQMQITSTIYRSTSYKVWSNEGFSVHSWNGKFPQRKDSIKEDERLKKSSFHVYTYFRNKDVIKLCASVNYVSRIPTTELSNKQLDKFFSLMNQLFINSKKSNLKGNIEQSMDINIQNQYGNLIIGPLNTIYQLDFPKFSNEYLPEVSDFLAQSGAENFRDLNGGILKATYNFSDGIVEQSRGDYVYERLLYMDKKGNTGAYEPTRTDTTLDDFIRRDLQLKKILSRIKIS